MNTGQSSILNPFLGAAIKRSNLGTKFKENRLDLSGGSGATSDVMRRF